VLLNFAVVMMDKPMDRPINMQTDLWTYGWALGPKNGQSFFIKDTIKTNAESICGQQYSAFPLIYGI